MNRNIPLFLAFRLLFNARFYYPIFAVLQLDYGLTMSQFAILNAVWAVSIVLLEVPSGVFADLIGRKRMVVLAAILMVVELALIAFVPLGNSTIVFWVWVLNRILSGAAEAAASGADEALAYDSIPEAEQKTRWPGILSRLMTLSSLAFVVAMLVGAAVYDPTLLNRLIAWLGGEAHLDKASVLRFPVYLTLATAICAVFVSLAMKEPPRCNSDNTPETSTSMWREIFEVGKWILRKPFVFAIILAALVHDSVVRLFLTSSSEYYRLIEIPVAWFGPIGAALAGFGVFVPKIAEWLVHHRGIRMNYALVSLVIFLGLAGLALAIPVWGVLMAVLFRLGLGLLHFFTSHYLNAEVDSRRRATVLSFKGLALNVGFGLVCGLYALLLAGLNGEGGETNQIAFRESLYWLPGTFLVMLGGFLVWFFSQANREVPRKIS